MATYQILYWHDIPLQVRAYGEDGRASAQLTQRFQEAVDSAAMAAGLLGSDAYIEAMYWGQQDERPGLAKDVASAVIAEIEAAYPTIDWRATVAKIKSGS